MGTVVWVTGLPRAGKTTIGRCVAADARLRGRGIHLDGDSLREILPSHMGFSREERRQLAYFYASLAGVLAKQGKIVVVSTVSLFHDVHKANRALNINYVEILVDAPDGVRRDRDSQGVYRTTRDVMGRDILPEMPFNPDLVLQNGGEASVDQLGNTVVEMLLERGFIRP
ncbi:adenylyl-sulfate kinase [Austwickia sp. TVS 96-490-7B]|uniref:adenylyl-sulfate kinase n=1 Tax=Austwickia sp. TVS 96-490-7B TaxID=2830843 RepID=UPI0021080B79|nr:adenylyl-sulfate kinase [Austwickia sp. TVS 96-490-7B]